MERNINPATRAEVRDTQVDPTAGIWYCPNCGRRIQEIESSDKAKKGPYVCVCGTSMEPGEEYTTVDPRIDEMRAPNTPPGTMER